MSKALRFLCITAEHQDRPFFTVFLTIKTSSRNIPITLADRFRLNFERTSRRLLETETASRERFWKNSSQCSEIV